MATSLHRWESDPLFSAAEVVQDSADRMESIFRHHVHEQGLVQESSQHPTLLASITHNVRDLKTTLETTKWQLEDFERAVSLAAVSDSSGMRADSISRHEQFVRAIRQQILDVEKYLENPLVKKSIESADLLNPNEQENDRLALFLSGGSHSEVMTQSELEDSNILRRFLDPTSQSGFSGSSNEIIEHGPEEIKNLSTNRVVPEDHDSFLTKSNVLRKVGSSSHVGSQAPVHFKITACDYYGEDGSWDLESSEVKSQNFKQRKCKSDHHRRNIFLLFGSAWSAYINRIRSLMKRWKDGEERQRSSSYTNIINREQERLGLRSSSWSGPFPVPSHELYTRLMRFCQWLCRITYYRSLYNLASRHPVQFVLAILCTLVVLAFLGTHMA